MSSLSNPRILDIVVYGLVNSGKSSLINALAHQTIRETSPTGGTTTEVVAEAWREILTEIGPYAVRLIDTPGLGEIDHPDREIGSTEAARHADLIVFVTGEDLTASARSAIVALHAWGKPLLIALNKVDLLGPGEEVLVLESVRRNLEGIIPPEDVLPISAAPIVRRRISGDDGRPRIEVVHGDPEIEAIEARLLEAIEAAPHLEALANASEEVEEHIRIRDADRARRRERAERVADETSVGLALALAVNPVPLIDFLTGPSGVAILVRRVSGVYEESLDVHAIRKLSSELIRGGRAAMWGSLAGVGIGGALKILPGLGHLAGALTQGSAAGYFGHVLGRALVVYFENGRDWGDAGLNATLDQIAANTDRRALTRGLVERLKAQLSSQGKAEP